MTCSVLAGMVGIHVRSHESEFKDDAVRYDTSTTDLSLLFDGTSQATNENSPCSTMLDNTSQPLYLYQPQIPY